MVSAGLAVSGRHFAMITGWLGVAGVGSVF
jgi:hypothetical protein